MCSCASLRLHVFCTNLHIKIHVLIIRWCNLSFYYIWLSQERLWQIIKWNTPKIWNQILKKKKITLNHFINFLIRTLQFVILPFCFTLSRTILKLRYKRSSYRLTGLKTVGVIYKRNGKTEVERGVNTRERGRYKYTNKNKEIKKGLRSQSMLWKSFKIWIELLGFNSHKRASSALLLIVLAGWRLK